MSIREPANLMLLVGGAVALIGGILGLASGFFGAGSALAIVVGMVSLVLFRQLSSEWVVVVLIILDLILPVLTGGLASVGESSSAWPRLWFWSRGMSKSSG